MWFLPWTVNLGSLLGPDCPKVLLLRAFDAGWLFPDKLLRFDIVAGTLTSSPSVPGQALYPLFLPLSGSSKKHVPIARVICPLVTRWVTDSSPLLSLFPRTPTNVPLLLCCVVLALLGGKADSHCQVPPWLSWDLQWQEMIEVTLGEPDRCGLCT